VLSLHGNHGYNRHPAFPAPSLLSEEQDGSNNSGDPRRGNAESYPLFDILNHEGAVPHPVLSSHLAAITICWSIDAVLLKPIAPTRHSSAVTQS
jgi:hypothetical protein